MTPSKSKMIASNDAITSPAASRDLRALAQLLELLGADLPAAFEAHFLVLLIRFFGPMARAGGVARALSFRFDLEQADHERPGGGEIGRHRIGEDETLVRLPREIDAVMVLHLAIRAVEGRLGAAAGTPLLLARLGAPGLGAEPFGLTL